ncbi:EF-hand [Panus rudis PR-1116 ss-1]|nr:EF-hand [Panus rudis PR-1116 ss-1]
MRNAMARQWLRREGRAPQRSSRPSAQPVRYCITQVGTAPPSPSFRMRGPKFNGLCPNSESRPGLFAMSSPGAAPRGDLSRPRRRRASDLEMRFPAGHPRVPSAPAPQPQAYHGPAPGFPPQIHMFQSQSIPHPHSSPPAPTQKTPERRPSPKIISRDEDITRLFRVCTTGKEHAQLLHEAVIYAKPEDTREKGLLQEFLQRCRQSQEMIASQIPWATAQAERSSNAAGKTRESKEEALLAELLDANEQLLGALKSYEDLETALAEKEVAQATKVERKLQILSAITALAPTTAESSLVNEIFSIADTSRQGFISIVAATKILQGAGLPPRILDEILRIANVEENDVLSRQVVAIAVRLLGHAQAQQRVSSNISVDESMILRPAEQLVRIDGLDDPTPSNHPNESGPSTPSLPPLTPQDREKFLRIFAKSGAQNNMLSGQEARDLFMKSKLPVQTLAHIWELADPYQRGALDAPSFIVAMYLIQGVMSGRISTLPPTLPENVYLAANGSFSPPPSSSSSSSSSPPIASGSSPSNPPPLPPKTIGDWDVDLDIRTTANQFFDVLDEKGKGYIDVHSAKGYFEQSGLPVYVIHQIWRLADVDSDGRLTREEFAVAMYLIQMRESGKVLPVVLPSSLVPPSMRRHPPPSSSTRTQEAMLIDLSDDAPTQDSSSVRPSMRHHQSQSSTSSMSAGSASSTSILDELTPVDVVPKFPVPMVPTGSANSPLYEIGASSPTSPTPTSPSSMKPPNSMTIPNSMTPPSSMTTPRLSFNPPNSNTTPTPFGSPPPSAIPSDWYWAVTPSEKLSSDHFFEILDPFKRGYVEREAGVLFLGKSGLGAEVIERIWDLADIDHDDRLLPEDFAVAMHLVRDKLSGKDLPGTTTLPPELVPPSVRNGTRQVPPPPPPPRRQPAAAALASQDDGASGSGSGSGRGVQMQSLQAVHDVPETEDDVRSATPPPPYEPVASDAQ